MGDRGICSGSVTGTTGCANVACTFEEYERAACARAAGDAAGGGGGRVPAAASA